MLSVGTIRYGKSSWYMVIDCCPELGRLYRTLFYESVYRTRKIQKPLYGNHITVIRREEPTNKDLWFKYDGMEIQFEYSPLANCNRYYHWLPIKCSKLDEIRVELGLTNPPICPYHMTFGNEIVKPPDYDERPYYE